MTGVELLMGARFASVVIGKVVDLGRSYLGDNYKLHTETREMLTNLDIQLPYIQSVIESAEKQQITNKGLDRWFEQLKDAAYEAEDVLDHFEAKRIRESIKGKGKVSEIATSSGRMVKNLFYPDKDLKELKSVVKKLDKLCMGVGDFIKIQAQCDKGKGHLGNLGSETSSYLAPGVTIFGRDKEIKLILDMILNVLYGDFNHKSLDDPNLQQGEEGSSCHSDKIFKNWLSWGTPGRLMFIQTFPPKQSKKGLLRLVEYGKSVFSGVVIKGDAPEQGKNSLGMSESRKSMSSGTIEKGDAPELSREEALGLGESGKSMSSGTTKKDDATEERKKGLLGLSESGKSMSSGKMKKGDAPKQSEEGLLGLIEYGKSLFSGIVKKGDTPIKRNNVVTTITTMAEPHSISNRKLAVIPIVGLGGVGKTTVAKMIYNDERVKGHFALQAWVYVSEIHDSKKIMQEMLCSFKECGIENGSTTIYSENLNIVEKRLIQTINNQRFLLILDDLTDRTEHIWSRLRSVLYYGEVGSVVVVTTQSIDIAKAIRTLPEVKLDVLKPDLFWELFQYYAFGGFMFGDQPTLPMLEQEELKKIGKQIAEKLHGLPLAGEVIGTLLSTRLEKEFWEDICGNDWWNIEGAREKILPSIGVGYNYLESELKQCFVFCSIFPRQYVFERKRLVQMWIAQGFIQPSKGETGRLDKGETRLEDIGRKRFDKLVDRIFFQPTLSDGKYVMHDLVRDLAFAVSSNEFCFVKSHNKHLPSSAHHLGINCDYSEVEWKCKNSTRLRTVILFGDWTNNNEFISNIFANYKGLRVLDSSYIVLETNDSIKAICLLFHLRFVDLSFTGIKLIPDEFCALCHLQVLDVRGCNFEKLPKGMNQLVNLRHLYASSETISLISSIGKLTKLQELEEFRIENSEGHRISELKDMNEISGHLLLSKLQNISSKEEAAKSKLDKKKYLKSLELRFDFTDDDMGPTTNMKMEILDALKPAPSLEVLKIRGCSGESLPGWMCSSHPVFYNLKVIHISHFQLRSLPAFGELPSLKLLSFHALSSIDKVGSKFYGSSDVIFPSLKELTFSRMSRWRNWEDGEVGKTIFPHLKKLHLNDCRSLITLPLYALTSVVELTLSKCRDLNIETVRTPSLAHFSITNRQSVSIDCTRLKFLEVLHLMDNHLVYFVGGLKYLVKLREFTINCYGEIRHTYKEHPLVEISHDEYEKQCLQSLTFLHLCSDEFITHESLPRLGRLPSLHTLLIENFFSFDCKMEDQESWFNQLTSLEKLEFRNCWTLSCLPSQLHLLTSLKKLHINDCHSLRSLPEEGLPPNLVELYIEECPDLIRRCQPNQGDNWHKISHIPFVHLIGEIGTLQIQSP